MTTAAKLAVINSAMVALEEPVFSNAAAFDSDTGTIAVDLRLMVDDYIRAAMAEFPWRHFRKRETLSGGTALSLERFEYQFDLPADYVQYVDHQSETNGYDSTDVPIDFEIGNGVLLSNNASPVLHYVYYPETGAAEGVETAYFSHFDFCPNLKLFVAYRIATMLSMVSTGTTADMARLEQMSSIMFDKAKAEDQRARPAMVNRSRGWWGARRRGGTGRFF